MGDHACLGAEGDDLPDLDRSFVDDDRAPGRDSRGHGAGVDDVHLVGEGSDHKEDSGQDDAESDERQKPMHEHPNYLP